MKSQTTLNGISAYILSQSKEVQPLLEKLREKIKQAAPGAEEVISYQMPAFKLNGVLVYFAAYKNHIGFYPTSPGIREFQKEFGAYKWSKGAVQFPLDQAIPFALVTKIVKFRVKENQEKLRLKTKSVKKSKKL